MKAWVERILSEEVFKGIDLPYKITLNPRPTLAAKEAINILSDSDLEAKIQEAFYLGHRAGYAAAVDESDYIIPMDKHDAFIRFEQSKREGSK